VRVLVDTSVWIDFLKGNPTKGVEQLKQLLQGGLIVGLTALIYQEILQGADSQARYQRFKSYFGGQRFFHPLDPVESYTEAAAIYYRCRQKGLTIHSSTDCLIARICVEHDAVLLHHDRDFDYIAEVESDLKLLNAI